MTSDLEQARRMLHHAAQVCGMDPGYAELLARVSANVLLTGPTGVGKSSLARAMAEYFRTHHRITAECVFVNCATLVPTLFESEVFGHKKGAFTGATTDTTGLLEKSSGVLILDEIGELEPHLQVKLNVAIEDRKFHRIGERGYEKNVSCRKIIACTLVTASDKMRDDLTGRFVLQVAVKPLDTAHPSIERLLHAAPSVLERTIRELAVDRESLEQLTPTALVDGFIFVQGRTQEPAFDVAKFGLRALRAFSARRILHMILPDTVDDWSSDQVPLAKPEPDLLSIDVSSLTRHIAKRHVQLNLEDFQCSTRSGADRPSTRVLAGLGDSFGFDSSDSRFSQLVEGLMVAIAEEAFVQSKQSDRERPDGLQAWSKELYEKKLNQLGKGAMPDRLVRLLNDRQSVLNMRRYEEEEGQS